MARRNSVNVGAIRDNRGKVNIAGRDLNQTFNTIIRRALTAAEEAAAARKLESKLLAQGVGNLARSISAVARGPTEGETPYKGLLSYGLNESEIFYGRSEAQKDLLNCIRQSPLTVLHAEIGAGKSSLLQAGIAAELIAGGHLAVHLRPYDADPVDFIKRMFLSELSQAPALAQASLREFLQQVCAVLGSKVTLYLLLDQFEEFFHLLKKDERTPFLDSLAECLNDPSLKVRWVLALRADALSNLAELESFGIAPFKNTYRLNRLQRSEAREAITGPAARFDIRFEPDLLDHILDTLGTHEEVMPTQLQLVCSALMENLPEDRTLTLGYYTEQEGGTEGILRDYLKRQLEHLPAAEQALAWKLLRALITADGQRAVRSYDEIVQELRLSGVSKKQIDTILGRLVERRLLFAQPTTAETFELAHDYLIKEIEIDPQEQARKAAQELLDQETRSYRRHGTLLSPERLAVIMPHRQEVRLSEDAEALLNESQKVVQREELARERRRRNILVGSFVIAVFMSLLAFWGWTSSQAAREQARISRAGELAALALSEKDSQFDTALLFGAEALNTFENSRTEGALLALVDSHRGLEQYLRGNSGYVSSTAFSPDGMILASGSQDGTVILWDVRDPHAPSQLAALPAAEGGISSIAFRPGVLSGPQVLAVGSWEGTIVLWDVTDPGAASQLFALPEQSSPVLSVAFSPDGKILASGNLDGTIFLWDASDPGGASPPVPLTEHTDAVSSVAFSLDGKTLASGSWDGTIALWNVSDPAAPSRLIQWPAAQDIIASVVFSPDGKTLVSGAEDPAIILWDISDPGRSRQLAVRSGHDSFVYGLAFSPDGKNLASAGNDKVVILWDVSDQKRPQPRIRLRGHNSPVSSVAFSPDGKQLASGSFDKVVILWDVLHLSSPSQLATLSRHKDAVSSVTFSPDGKHLASGSDDTSVLLWDVHTPGAPSEPTLLTGHSAPVASVAFSPDGKRLASGSSDQTVLLWDISTLGAPSKPVVILGHASPVASVAFSPLEGGKILAAGFEDGTVILWDVGDPEKPVQLAAVEEHSDVVYRVAFSPDGKTLASGGLDQRVILWDVSNPKSPTQARLIEGSSAIYSLAFSSDGETLAVGFDDRTIILWDVRNPGSPLQLATLAGHSETVYGLAFDWQDRLLASGSQDGRIILWDISDRSSPFRLVTLSGHPGFIYSVAFSPDGKRLASGSSDTTVVLWDLDPSSWVQKACQRAGRNFTQSEWKQYFPNETYRPTCPQWPPGK